MTRRLLSDGMWEAAEKALRRNRAHITKTTRDALEAMLWRARTGAPWRDLPTEFGPWKTAYNRFNRWSKDGRIAGIFESLKVDVDGEWQSMDATIVKAHQHASGARGKGDEAIGHSRGGATTKVHALCDANGHATELVVTQGQTNDVTMAPVLLAAAEDGAEAIIADKAYDAAHVREAARSRGMTPVIPFRTCTQEGRRQGYDKAFYRLRHLVENLFCSLKHFRAIATRYDKTARNYLATVHLVAAFLWLALW
jgi:transposase